ncbi:UMP kinase [Chitinispirillales bacterium ANBcel5]|uniref:UMP kinase n=1 Tax=Cellulosispirillum alkaliphilum TaxID=3039283 RepID=UPI002A569743|nr:UMP kinase [Chitinispirillales bacterium ANBcel5]
MAFEYKKILLKLSGEALAGSKGFGINPDIASQIAQEIAQVHKAGVQIGIVIGGGNFIRGASAENVSRVAGDAMGMLATVINSIAFAQYLQNCGVDSRVLTAVRIDKAGEYYTQPAALEHLNKNRIVLLAGGTGNPFFTTDTAAALRCAEIGGEVILKATKVDGVYDSDPMKNPEAKRYDQITHTEALSRNLKVMDSTAFSFCMEQKLPIIVFKLLQKGNLRKVLEGEAIGSIVKTGG